MSDEWIDWDERRPDQRGLYWWRTAERDYGGLVLRPECVSLLRLVGMGYGDPELWPSFSNWDGYHRTVPKGTQWRPSADAKEDACRFVGLSIAGCPFCESLPLVRWAQMSSAGDIYFGSHVHQSNCFKLICDDCGMAESRWTVNLKGLVSRWNAGRESQLGLKPKEPST